MHSTAQVNLSDDEIDLKEVARVLWGRRLIIVVSVVVATAASIIIAICLPDVYKAEAVLMPTANRQDTGLGTLVSQYGALAGVAGIDITGLENTDRTAYAIRLLKSRRFVADFIRKHDAMVELMAAENWDRNSGELTFDSEIYDVRHKKWVRKAKKPFKSEPSMQEAYEVFMDNFSVEKSSEDDFIILSVEHISPYIAKQWVDWLVADLNQTIRDQDVVENERSVEYLEQKILATPLTELKNIFAELIQDQLKTIMLANVRAEYALRTVDPAVLPLMKSKPNRLIICVLGAFVGAVLVSIFVLAGHYSGAWVRRSVDEIASDEL